MSCKNSGKSPCGCCELTSPSTPVMVENRPGLASISYRVGTYGAFRQAMIHAISRYPELSTWTVRTSDDHGIAWIEMWSYLADILTFYQERIANEAYLRTAILPESVMRLAALLDYRLVPGVAASTYLAFMLEKGKEVNIPSGLRVQSVPGQGEKPQKYETVKPIAADSWLSRLEIYPQPQTNNPFEYGITRGNLQKEISASNSKYLSPGDMFVIFYKEDLNDEPIEEKQIVSLQQNGPIRNLSWIPGIQGSNRNIENSRAFKFMRKYRLFGYNAPYKYLYSYPDLNGDIKWIWIAAGYNGDVNGEHITYDFKIHFPYKFYSDTTTLVLDALYDDLKNGMQILIWDPSKDPSDLNGKTKAILTTIKEVHQISAKFGPLNSTVSSITVEKRIPDIYDRREVLIYRLEGPEIQFLNYCIPSEIKDQTFYIMQTGLKNIEPERALIIDDEKQIPQLVTVVRVEPSNSNPGYLAVTFRPKLSRSLDSKTAFIYGNVAGATHGETVKDEVLGDGDASVGLQSFQISNSPVTFVHQAKSPLGAANTLQIRVDGILWHEACSFYGRCANERIYTSEIDTQGKTIVRFGDGQNGARLPSGSGNVTATYRKGSGKEGIVKANTLKTLLDRPLGLKSVINPFEAEGGDDREGLEDVRKNAPNTVRTFDRIVSLRDFEDAAREFKGYVAKAKSTWYWDGEEQAVLLTVAGVRDKDPSPILTELVDYLNVRRDRNRKLRVSARKKMPIRMAIEVKADSDYLDKDVHAAVTMALNDHLAFENLNLGQSIHLSDLYQAIQCVGGVVASHITMLQFKGLSDSELKKRLATFHLENGINVPDSVQNHLYISSEELIVVENPDTDIIVNLWGGQQ